MNKFISSLLPFLLLWALATPVSAIEFTRLFAAAPGGVEGDHFPVDTATIYIRYVYQGARPGQTLNSYWIIQQSTESEAGQFSTSKVTLEKADDLGQFSFSPEQGWPAGHYQVVLTDGEDQIVGEVLFRMGEVKPLATAEPNLMERPEAPASTETQLTDNELAEQPGPLFERVNPTPPAVIADLLVDQITLAGPDQGKGDKAVAGSASTIFASNTPVINLRLQYKQAQVGEIIHAFWRHQARDPGDKKGASGSGLFAQTQLQLQETQGKAHFAFHPEQGQWLLGRYQIELVARNQTLATADFQVVAPPKKVAPVKKSPSKPARQKTTDTSRSTGPNVLEATLAKSIENAAPKERTAEFTDVWRRLLLWARIDAGDKNATITSRWYSGKTGGELQATHRQEITPGENWVVFWLHLKNPDAMLPVGPARVELMWGKKNLKTIHYEVKKAGFFDGLSDSFQQMGNEIQWLLDQNLDN